MYKVGVGLPMEIAQYLLVTQILQVPAWIWQNPKFLPHLMDYVFAII